VNQGWTLTKRVRADSREQRETRAVALVRRCPIDRCSTCEAAHTASVVEAANALQMSRTSRPNLRTRLGHSQKTAIEQRHSVVLDGLRQLNRGPRQRQRPGRDEPEACSDDSFTASHQASNLATLYKTDSAHPTDEDAHPISTAHDRCRRPGPTTASRPGCGVASSRWQRAPVAGTRLATRDGAPRSPGCTVRTWPAT
jgi:hypothetical protein